MRVAAHLGREAGENEQLLVGSLPVAHESLGVAVACPEEVAFVGISLLAGGSVVQQLGYMRRNRTVDRLSAFALVEDHAPFVGVLVVLQPHALQSDGVADA